MELLHFEVVKACRKNVDFGGTILCKFFAECHDISTMIFEKWASFPFKTKKCQISCRTCHARFSNFVDPALMQWSGTCGKPNPPAIFFRHFLSEVFSYTLVDISDKENFRDAGTKYLGKVRVPACC
jgi:hypothetical protein